MERTQSYQIEPMNEETAVEISVWQYEEPYELYSMDGSESCIQELMNGNYYSCKDQNGEVIGYYCYGFPATVPAGRAVGIYDEMGLTDIGLGLRPDLCGIGNGADFMKAGMQYARIKFSATGFRLTVAVLNSRASRLYRKLGFQWIGSFVRDTEVDGIKSMMKFDVMISKV